MQFEHLAGKRAAIYVRYSSDLQDEGTLASQEAEIKEFADVYGLQIGQFVYRDQEASGTHLARPGLQQLLDDAKAVPRKFDVVLVWKWSRLSRDKCDSAQLKRLLRDELGIHIIAVSELSDPDTTEGLITETITEMMDHIYIKRLGQETLRGQKQAVRDGFVAGGCAPFGYQDLRIDDPGGRKNKDGTTKKRTKREVDPVRADVVRRIFQMYLRGMGTKKIAATLNEERTVAPRSHSWGPGTIRTILLNPVYTGKRVHNRRSFTSKRDGKRRMTMNAPDQILTIDAPELEIVDQETWDAVQAEFAKRKRGQIGGGKRSIKYLFATMIKCGAPSLSRPGEICGATFIAQRSSKQKGGKIYQYTRYVCGHRVNRGTSVCRNMVAIEEDRLARIILDVLEQDLFSEVNIQRLVDMTRKIVEKQLGRSDGQIKWLLAEIAKLDKEIGKYSRAIASAGNVEELAEEVRQRSERKALYREQLRDIRDLTQKERDLDGLADEVRQRIGNTLQLIRDTDCAPAFQKELRRHIEAMTVLPSGLLKMEGALIGLLPTKMVAGGRFVAQGM